MKIDGLQPITRLIDTVQITIKTVKIRIQLQ